MRHGGIENLNVREQLAVHHFAYILSCSVCLHLDRPVWVAHVLSCLLHLTFRQPNVRSEGCLRIHLSLRLSLVLHSPAPKSTWFSRLVVLQYCMVLSSALNPFCPNTCAYRHRQFSAVLCCTRIVCVSPDNV